MQSSASFAAPAAAEIAAVVVEDASTFLALKAPIRRVCAASVPVPYSPPMEDFALPDQARIVAAVQAGMHGGR